MRPRPSLGLHALGLVSLAAALGLSLACKPSAPAPTPAADATASTGAARTEATETAEPLAARDALTPLRQEGDPVAASGLHRAPSGVEFVVVQEGSGSPPTLGARVLLHHTGWLRRGDRVGRRIADSREGGEPEPFLLAASTPRSDGLDSGVFSLERPLEPLALEGLVSSVRDMRPGERRWILIPASLAYGSAGFPPTVPPDADLVFDVQLVRHGPR